MPESDEANIAERERPSGTRQDAIALTTNRHGAEGSSPQQRWTTRTGRTPTPAQLMHWAEAVLTLNINGTSHDIDVPPDMPLLWVLRDVLGMTGTKYGCGIASAAPAPSTSTASARARA